MQNSIVMFTFYFFGPDIPFWGRFGAKNRIVILSWKLVSRLIWIFRIQWWYSFFFPFFDQKYHFWVNLIQKINCQFKLKFGPWTNLSMYNSMVIFAFSTLDQKCLFWVQNIEIVGLSCNLIMQNSMMMFTFFCFWLEITFLGLTWSQISKLFV